MKLPITRTQQNALDWLSGHGGRQGPDGSPFRADTWRKLLARGFIREDDFGHLEIVPIDPPLALSLGDIEEAVLATRKQAETFQCKTM